MRMDNIQMFYEAGYNVFILSYRGYSNSQGKPSEQGLKFDSQAAFDYLLNCDKINSQQIIVFGRSLGGAVAIDLVSKNQKG